MADNCPFCQEPLVFEEDYLFGEDDDNTDEVIIRATCPNCKANFHLTYKIADYKVIGYN